MEAGVLSLGYSILFGLLLSEGKTFLFFFFFFHMVLSLLGSQSYLGCCYQKVEPSLFFFTWFCLSWLVNPIWAVVI